MSSFQSLFAWKKNYEQLGVQICPAVITLENRSGKSNMGHQPVPSIMSWINFYMLAQTKKSSPSSSFPQNSFHQQNCANIRTFLCFTSPQVRLPVVGRSVVIFQNGSFVVLPVKVRLSVGRLVGWLVCHNFLKKREVSLSCFYRGTR